MTDDNFVSDRLTEACKSENLWHQGIGAGHKRHNHSQWIGVSLMTELPDHSRRSDEPDRFRVSAGWSGFSCDITGRNAMLYGIALVTIMLIVTVVLRVAH
jgi:hypothetical protein